MKRYVILFTLALCSCSKNPNLDDKFRETAISYQKKFPIPTNTEKAKSKRMFIYEASFYKKNKDTVFELTRKNMRVEDFFDGYEIYQDDALKPLIVIDNENLCRDFVYKKRDDNPRSLWWAGDSYDTRQTEVYRYRIKNKDIIAITAPTQHLETN